MAPLNHFRRYIKHSFKLAGVLLNERLAGVAGASDLPLPPPRLRHRVHGAMDAESFLQVGSACARDIAPLTKRHGPEMATFERVLDFGCGCGRTIRFFKDHPATQRLYGADMINRAGPRACGHSREPRLLDTEPGTERNAGSASNAVGDGCGRAPSDQAGFQPYRLCGQLSYVA